MPKYHSITRREVVDPETGELVPIETGKYFTERIQEDSFYMTFIDYVSPLFGLKPEGAKNLLVWLCQNAQFNTGQVSLTTADRRKITKELGLSNNSITNYLKKLKDLNLIQGDSGSYMINPQIFWKGDLNVRRDLLKKGVFKISFDIQIKEDESEEENKDKK